MLEKIKEDLQKLYGENGFDVYGIEAHQFEELIILECNEYHPIGKDDKYTVIYKDGVYFNSNFENLEEFLRFDD